MKIKFIISVLICGLLFSSCKEEKVVKEKKNFSVIIEGVFEKNDKLQVFYLISGDVWKDDNSVSIPVYASKEMQKIVVDFPEKVVPENIRVDLGFNPTQTNVTIKNISVKYKSKIINGDLEKYTKYFYPNEFVTWDPSYFGYKLNVINDKYDPFLMGNDELAIQLVKITQ
ncbi:hypothetical protein [Flavobacterium ginsenosidimutans]|uniref:Lipoprotein n=1 Tax=Flavobacterium ginsenosidimutans TaxID=687844 RepID=A0ABZ2QCT0_9FLAO